MGSIVCHDTFRFFGSGCSRLRPEDPSDARSGSSFSMGRRKRLGASVGSVARDVCRS